MNLGGKKSIKIWISCSSRRLKQPIFVMWSCNAKTQTTSASEPNFKLWTPRAFPARVLCTDLSFTKYISTFLLVKARCEAYGCSARDKWSVRTSLWAGISQNSTGLDRSGSSAVVPKDFSVCQDREMMSVFTNRFCNRDRFCTRKLCDLV